MAKDKGSVGSIKANILAQIAVEDSSRSWSELKFKLGPADTRNGSAFITAMRQLLADEEIMVIATSPITTYGLFVAEGD